MTIDITKGEELVEVPVNKAPVELVEMEVEVGDRKVVGGRVEEDVTGGVREVAREEEGMMGGE